MSQVLRVAVAGANGRLGREICAAIAAADDVEMTFGLVRPGGSASGLAAPVLESLSSNAPDFDVLIDVSTCDGVLSQLPALHKPMVIGVTGFSPEQNTILKTASKRIAILRTGNFSLGVNLLLALTEQAAKALGPNWRVQITETHHVHKQDFPSGTALMLAAAAQQGLGQELAIQSVLYPDKPNTNDAGILPISSIRQGEEIGQHTLRLTNGREEVVLAHTALQRGIFADGALVAAKWVSTQKPGLYAMRDVLHG
ncbi:MAG: 4-hydroxy-tetrahydrodipicolinate reductase [Robiginitomaculum sp.]|nr:4-hydroxy-tetrahydrodipicolinate reductase [Robiginitomaculum sp.]